MPAYMIAQIEITDPIEYQKYLDGFMPIFQRHGGELLAASSKETKVLEGHWEYPKTVLMRFPDKQAAEKWFADPDYQALAKYRHAAAHANLALVEGIG